MTENWIIDGNYSRAMDKRIECADTVIFLDFNRYFCMFRVVKRWWKYRGKTRPELADGCPDKLDRDFLAFVWNWHKAGRAKTVALINELCDGKAVYRFKKRKEIRRFLEGLDA